MRSGSNFSFLPVLMFQGFSAFGFGPTVSLMPRVADARLDSALARTERGLIQHNVDPYSDGLLHRPNSEQPGDAVSEGQAYGMIATLYSNDQANFNRIWDAAENKMWDATGKQYNWRIAATGGVIGTGMATDADEDIALMLLFADSLVSKGIWKAHTGPKGSAYRARALDIIGNIWNSAVAEGRYLAPGAGWGGKAFVNPGYFSPASYKIFAKVDPGHNWNGVVDQCYLTLFANPGAGQGLLPDWMVPDGSLFNGSLGYNAFRGGQSMYKDAIRVHWRLAMDWLWFGDARAKRWLDSASAFIASPDRANFYTLDGNALPVTDTFTLGDGQWRSRREYSEMTLGMWACAPFASMGLAGSQAWVDSLMAFAPAGTGLWGRALDTALPHRDGSTPNEEYFEQFLAWFGTAVLAGRFSNIWDDLDDPLPGVPVAWTTAPTVGPDVLDFQQAPLHVAGVLNKPETCTLRITNATNNLQWSASVRTANLSLDWNGLDATGARFPQGWCQATLLVPGLPDYTHWVWLSHQRDIRLDANWLIVDDFSAPTLQPNLGSWGSFNNSGAGGNAQVGPLAPAGSGADRALTWTYDLGTGGYQYCGLEWQANAWPGLSYVNQVRYRARAAQRAVIDFYLVQSDITDDNYFGAFDTLGATWKTYTHHLADFKGRLNTRSGSANAAKGTAFRWHIQFDKNPSAATGNVTVDDFDVGGNMAAMYTPPDSAVPPSGNPPALGVSPRKEILAPMRPRWRNGLLQWVTQPFAKVRWISVQGRLLGTSYADSEGSVTWVPPQGIGLFLAQIPGQRTVPIFPSP